MGRLDDGSALGLAAPIDAASAQRYPAALARAAGSDGESIVWYDGDSELLLWLVRARLELRADRVVLVRVPVFCEETGDVEIVVPFAVDRHAEGGLVAATDAVPHGPPEVVNRWGEALVAAAWRALAEVAAG